MLPCRNSAPNTSFVQSVKKLPNGPMAIQYTAAQQRAIDAVDTNLQIIACAGSGKTDVISRRIAELLKLPGVTPANIVAFTFMDPATIRWVVYAGVIGALTGTVIAARTPNVLKPKVVVIAAAAQLVSAAAVLALSESRFATLVGVILGLAIFFPMPFFVQLAFLRPGVTAREISVTFSIFWAVSYAGSVIIIQVFAWIADATGGLSGGVPVSNAPLIYIVVIEAGFLIGTFLLARHLGPTLKAAAAAEAAEEVDA